MSEVGTFGSSPWYRSLNGAQWKALVASNLGWTFDGFEVFALILTVGVALHQLLDPSQYPFIPAYAGAIIAITVFGWGLGGLLGGVLADYLGRKRSMTLTILAYSLLTGVSALSWDWVSFAAEIIGEHAPKQPSESPTEHGYGNDRAGIERDGRILGRVQELMQGNADSENECEYFETVERPSQIRGEKRFPLRPVERAIPWRRPESADFAHDLLPKFAPAYPAGDRA